MPSAVGISTAGIPSTTRLMTATGVTAVSCSNSSSAILGDIISKPSTWAAIARASRYSSSCRRSEPAMNSAYPAARASRCTAFAMTDANELAMSGTTMPMLPVRPRASERATGFGS